MKNYKFSVYLFGNNNELVKINVIAASEKEAIVKAQYKAIENGYGYLEISETVNRDS